MEKTKKDKKWIRIGLLVILAILNMFIVGCANQNELKKESGLVILDKKTISLFKEGKINGIPFPLKGFPMQDVREKWGEPDKQIDNEDIQDYVYIKKKQEITFTVDETDMVNYYQIVLDMSLNEVNERLGNKKTITKSTKSLNYPMGKYNLFVKRLPNEQTDIILRN
jgi:hypothetical protein